MADNVQAGAAVGSGPTFASDDIGGIHYPRSKVVWGPDGTANDADVASGKPLPVQLRTSGGVETGVNANPVQVGDAGGSLTVDVGAALPAGTNNIGDVDVASIAAGDNNIGNVDIVTVPADPFGANADAAVAAGAAGSIQAKLRRLTQGLEDLKTLIVLAAGDNNIGNFDLASAIPAGTNNIGDVDIASIAAGDNNIGNVDVVTLPALPAGTNNIGDVDVLSIAAGTNRIGAVYPVQGKIVDENGNVATVKVKSSVVSSSGVNAFIAAVASNKIRVLGFKIQARGTVIVEFYDTAGTPAQVTNSPEYSFQAREGAHATAYPGSFLFETTSGLGLQINLSAAVEVMVHCEYVEVP